MTRLQEIVWVDEALEQSTALPTAKQHSFPARIDLYRIPWIRSVLNSRWVQLALRTVTLLGFIFTLVTAISGTLVGSHNFAIIVVWIAWWTALKLVFIPLGGRTWCSICPIPLAGDWIQRGGIWVNGKAKRGINLRWPTTLRGSWLQSVGFLVIGLFSAVTLTDPRLTGWVLLGLLLLSTGMSLIFEHRAFCSHVCPIGGFSGMYAKTAPVELRVVDRVVCIDHGDKSCYRACPWGIYPLTLKDNASCGLCLDCLRACPQDNLAVNLRQFGGDLANPPGSIRLDETFLALVMLGSALAFSAVFIGPWGRLKSAAYAIGSLRWIAFGSAFLGLTAILLPALYMGSIWVGKRMSKSQKPLKQLAATYTAGLLPLGLLSWIAFTLSFALPKINLVLGVLNDPFGWGWHVLNLAHITQTLDVSGFSPYLQVVMLLVGAFWSARVTRKISDQNQSAIASPHLPLLIFYMAYVGTFLWVLLG